MQICIEDPFICREKISLLNEGQLIAEEIFLVFFRYPFVMKKVSNWSELHLSEVTSYKIRTLMSNSRPLNLPVKSQNHQFI